MAKLKKQTKANQVLVSVVMGSSSDREIMSGAESLLKKFGVSFETRIVSAHRTPQDLYDYATELSRRGLRVVIAGAGGAAHLPGMVASLTELPVIGVPVPTKSMAGIDSLLSIAQMPAGVPVATVAIGGAENAALLAVQMLAFGGQVPHPELQGALEDYKAELVARVKKMQKSL
jgi:5-(carboxyamino)imidazole ribonucleotide mutase